MELYLYFCGIIYYTNFFIIFIILIIPFVYFVINNYKEKC